MKTNNNHIIIGITGGIGSGKTTISRYFEEYGIPVYHADDEAKALMNRSKVIRKKLIALFGDTAYVDNTLNRDYLRQKIFNDKTLLQKMNRIVHPKVGAHFKRWIKKQQAPYVLKEVAIIFENNLQDQYDYIITVVADEEERIRRVTNRDNTSKASVAAIISNQLPDADKIAQSDFVIYNNNLEESKKQVTSIHNQLLSKLN
ncbi:MAG: dephospho-CoA kinase [Winogradskyella sp.]|uniref:dephospho-CoA kinase n=1 Tax=Winogradskyella sp. TaxID=1883156 RepID=UPI001858A2FA|nr:dephospho-CoA kinase [Winogradskyella sp.]MBT8245847.1 dephospho-CoA kinase [Winogradskyella sp.]NNK22618.1 dephospho-CoA kinase [Winogradskyella sp.]